MKNAVILYDSDCPMCRLYTNSFVQCGLLDANGRVPYANQPDEVAALVNQDRARHEIALVNLSEKKVWYGLDSLVQILFGRFPFLVHLIHFPFLWYPLKGLYGLISYNRRIIAPRADGAEGDCAPDVHTGWRIAFITLANIATAFITLAFWKEHWLTVYVNAELNFYIMFGLLAFQYVVLLSYVHQLFPGKALAYGGHLAVSSLAGALLLWPVTFIAGPESWLRTAWLLMVYVFMFLDHLRRDKILKLDITVTGIWILYRVFLLMSLLLWKIVM